MRSWGFSLIELMVTVAVLAILVAIGLPSFQSSLRSNSVATGTNTLIASLSLARSEAIRSPGGAGLCASADGASCNGEDWNDGWIVWNDADGNGEPGDSDDRVLRHVEGMSSIAISAFSAPPAATPPKKIVFDRRGLPEASGGFKLQPTTCPSGHELIRTLVLTPTGQVRTEKASCE